MQFRWFFLFILIPGCIGLNGQVLRVPEMMLGERIVAVVPMVGTGSAEDPFRPKYAPVAMTPERFAKMQREGKLKPAAEMSDEELIAADKVRIGAYQFVFSDDGKRAIVEFVARDRAAFAEILRDPEVKVVEKAKLRDPNEVEELRKIRKDFDPSQLRTAGY